MRHKYSSFIRKFMPLVLVGVFLLGSPNTLAAEQYLSDNSNRTDPMQGQKQKGQASVGEFTGAAIYDYPITLPPGRNGMTPSLSITHNSQDSSLHNKVGYRWSMTEYSIERLNKGGVDKFYDRQGFIGWNDFTVNTPISSGEIVATDLVDNHHGTYAEKFETSFSKYEYLENDSWRVTDKQGNEYIFGASIDSRQFDPQTTSRTYRWMLEEIRDPNDNFIRYSYQKLNNQIYPKSIHYTGHGEEEGTFEVQFKLVSRPDQQFSYASGFLVETNHLIEGIEVYAQGQLRRKYELTYAQIQPFVRSVLSKITETTYSLDGKSTSLPPTEFEYSDSVISWEEVQDYLPIYNFLHCNYKEFGCAPHDKQFFWDVTGDGLIDIPTANNQGLNINDGNGSWKESLNNSFLPGQVPNASEKVIDFNGDARMDFFGSYLENGQVKSYLKGPGLNTDDTIDVALHGGALPDNGASVGDLNGDGLPDLIQKRLKTDNTFTRATCLNTNGNGCESTDLWQSPVHLIQDNTNFQNPRMNYVEDCNADGLADVNYSINNGKGGWTSVPGGHACVQTGVDTVYERTVDLNGDGLMDKVHAAIKTTYNSPEYIKTLKVSTGEGSDFQILEQNENNFPAYFGTDTGGNQADNAGIRIMDINGDLLPDVVQSYQETKQVGNNFQYSYQKHIWLHNGSRPYFLKTIHTSAGGEIDLEYKTSAQYIKADNTQANPRLPIIVDTVSRMTMDDGMGNISSTDYFYEEGHHYFANSYDRGFAGFGIVSKTDGLGYKTKNYYHQGEFSVPHSNLGEFQDHLSKKGRVYRTETYDQNQNLKSRNIQRFEHKTLGQNHFFPYVSQALSQTFDGGVTTSIAQAFTYDAWGNQTQVIDFGEVTATGEDGSFSDTGNDLLKTLMSFIDQTAYPVEQKLFDQSNKLLSHNRNYYDELPLGEVSQGNTTSQESWLDTNDSWITSHLKYNAYGLPITQTNPRGFSTQTEYDNENLYPIKISNAKGHQAEMEYDSGIGQPIAVTDPNGSTTVTNYDGFGRPLRVEKDSKLIRQIIYDDASIPRSIHQKNYSAPGEAVESYTYLDAFDRSVETKTEAANGKWVATQTLYDERGNMVKQIQPYFTNTHTFEVLNEGKIGNAFEYDTLGRVITMTNPLGTSTNSYQGFEMRTVDAEGHEKTLAYNARKNLIRVDERNANQTYHTHYTYAPNGLLTSIKDAQNNTRTFDYDSLGRRSFQSKLNSEKGWRYDYDQNNNLILKADPKGQVVEMTYDELDRATKEDFLAGEGVELSYQYDEGTNAIGRLTSINGEDYSRGLYYDTWGRVALDKKNFAGKTFEFGYEYDQMDALTSMVYPDNSKVIYRYNDAHQLEKIEEDGLIYAHNFTYTPLGQVVQIQLGNEIITTHQYDANKLYQLSGKSTLGGMNPLQNYQYTYDRIGNMLDLVDANSGETAKTIQYSYDDLNRLVEANYSHMPNVEDIHQTYSYDSIGNILFKSDVGEFLYDSEHPHAVTKAGEQSFKYDENGNLNFRDGALMEYDYRNRLTRSGNKVSFRYGEGYERLMKTDLEKNQTTYYPDKYYEIHPDKEVKYIYAGNQRIAKVERELFVEAIAPEPAPTPEPLQDGEPNPVPEGNQEQVTETPTPTTITNQPKKSGGGGSGGGGGYSMVDEARLIRLIRENQDAKASELARDIYAYNLNAVEEAEKNKIEAGALAEPSFPNLRVKYFRNSAFLTWSSLPTQVDHFKIYRSKGTFADVTEKTDILVGEVKAKSNGNRFVDHHFETYAKYSYKIIAYNYKGHELFASQLVHGRQIYLYGDRATRVDFRDFTRTPFTHVRVKSNEFVNTKETAVSQRLMVTADTGLKKGARLEVNFLNCIPKEDGGRYCTKVDQQFVEVYSIEKKQPAREYLSHLGRQFASLIPNAHAEEPEEKVYFLLTDHLGSVDVVTDIDGNVVERRDYLPFGSERLSVQNPDSTETDYGYTGKELDEETGLNYYGARYYDSELGRFMTVDPVSLGESDRDLIDILDNPQALNNYSYVLNNPLRFIDENGEYEEDVHLYLTTYLAEKAGYSSLDAFSIGLYNQMTDSDPSMAPIQFAMKPRELYHFVDQARLNELNKNARETLDAKEIGVFMHAYQDSFSHDGYGVVFGHLFDGHKPDKTYNDTNKANKMARGSFFQLRNFRFQELQLENQSEIDAYHQETQEIWSQIKNSVNDYNISTTKEKTEIGKEVDYKAAN